MNTNEYVSNVDVTNRSAEQIIADAEAYRKKSRHKMTYRDYEAYKALLHSNGFYGYEGQLAAALRI